MSVHGVSFGRGMPADRDAAGADEHAAAAAAAPGGAAAAGAAPAAAAAMPDAYGCVTLAFDRAEPLGLTLTPDCEVEAVGAGSQGAARGVVVGSRLVEVEGVAVGTHDRFVEQFRSRASRP